MKWKINRTKYLKKKAEMKSKSLDSIQATLRPSFYNTTTDDCMWSFDFTK